MRTRSMAAAAAAALTTVGLLIMPGAAGAFGGEHGVLRIHASGSVYAGSGGAVAVVTRAGSAASVALEVKNTSDTTAQFNIAVAVGNVLCEGECQPPAQSLSAGTLIVSPLEQGPNGYFTAPIAPGKTAAFTLKITPAVGSAGNDSWTYAVRLRDTAGNLLDTVLAAVEITSSTGPGTAYDLITNAAGGLPVSRSARAVTSPVLNVGQSTSFNVKLVNDSTAAAQIPFSIGEFSNGDCGTSFTPTVKAGLTDVTTKTLQGTYATASLAPGKSQALTVTVKYATAAPATCTYFYVFGEAGTGSLANNDLMLVNPAAT